MAHQDTIGQDPGGAGGAPGLRTGSETCWSDDFLLAWIISADYSGTWRSVFGFWEAPVFNYGRHLLES